MPAHPQLFNDDGVTPATPMDLALQVGDISAARTYYLYNDKGLVFGDTTTLRGARLRISVTSGGVEISEGEPLLDQRMLRATITGQDNTADPSQVNQVTGTIPIGTMSELHFDDILAGNARIFTLQVVASAVTGLQEIRFRIVDDGNSATLPAHVTAATGSGVLPNADGTRGGFKVTAGAGLSAVVAPGTGISTADTYQFSEAPVTLPLTASTTNYVWMRPDGTPSVTVTAPPPLPGAYLLALAVTDAGAVTDVSDKREIIDPPITFHVMRLVQRGAVTVANDVDWQPAPFDAVIDRIAIDVGTPGATTSGQWKADVIKRSAGGSMGVAGATLYTSFGTLDKRPVLAWNTASLRAENSDHEVLTVDEGDRLSASVVSVPAGASGTDLTVSIYLRRK